MLFSFVAVTVSAVAVACNAGCVAFFFCAEFCPHDAASMMMTAVVAKIDFFIF
jgi:hypothetical protein